MTWRKPNCPGQLLGLDRVASELATPALGQPPRPRSRLRRANVHMVPAAPVKRFICHIRWIRLIRRHRRCKSGSNPGWSRGYDVRQRAGSSPAVRPVVLSFSYVLGRGVWFEFRTWFVWYDDEADDAADAGVVSGLADP